MTVEIPEFKRCCFCLPLRAGLLAWGYFKIIAGVLIIPILAYFSLSTIVMMFMSGANKKYVYWIMLYTAIALITNILFITDFVATIVFIVGGHKKNVNRIRGFYIFCIGELIVTLLLILVAVGISIAQGVSSETKSLVIYAAYLLTLVVQAYFILLLRSEVIKLKSSGEFRFVNNSPEAQCIMTSKQNEAEIENA